MFSCQKSRRKHKKREKKKTFLPVRKAEDNKRRRNTPRTVDRSGRRRKKEAEDAGPRLSGRRAGAAALPGHGGDLPRLRRGSRSGPGAELGREKLFCFFLVGGGGGGLKMLLLFFFVFFVFFSGGVWGSQELDGLETAVFGLWFFGVSRIPWAPQSVQLN